jgi:hypothetical protein
VGSCPSVTDLVCHRSGPVTDLVPSPIWSRSGRHLVVTDLVVTVTDLVVTDLVVGG